VWVTLFVLAGLAFLLGAALMLFALMRTSRRP
jgi:ABC-type transporter Mla subunit MlaD